MKGGIQVQLPKTLLKEHSMIGIFVELYLI